MWWQNVAMRAQNEFSTVSKHKVDSNFCTNLGKDLGNCDCEDGDGHEGFTVAGLAKTGQNKPLHILKYYVRICLRS